MPNTDKRDEPSRIPQAEAFVRPSKPDRAALAKLLDEWMRGDETEQRETFETLRRSLDEDRPVGYKLFGCALT
jgi:hypothetical protein